MISSHNYTIHLYIRKNLTQYEIERLSNRLGVILNENDEINSMHFTQPTKTQQNRMQMNAKKLKNWK